MYYSTINGLLLIVREEELLFVAIAELAGLGGAGKLHSVYDV